MPKVSVIIPVYGVEQYIARCARSLFEQTLDDIEFLFIDDCSPDRSIDILKQVLDEYPSRKSQVLIHRMEVNSGQAAVRNWGLQNATGDYVIHCDSDDWVDTEMYKLLYDEALSSDADIVVCDFYRTDGVESHYEKGCGSVEPSIFKENLIRNNISRAVWNKLIKSCHYKNIDYPKSNMGEDMVYTLQIAYYIKRIAYVPKPLYFYYYNDASITKVKSEEKIYKNYLSVIENLRIINRFYSDKIIDDKIKSALNYLNWSQRDVLLPIVSKKKYYKMWRSVYPSIEVCILKDKNQVWRSRLKSLLTLLYIYPFNRFNLFRGKNE